MEVLVQWLKDMVPRTNSFAFPCGAENLIYCYFCFAKLLGLVLSVFVWKQCRRHHHHHCKNPNVYTLERNWCYVDNFEFGNSSLLKIVFTDKDLWNSTLHFWIFILIHILKNKLFLSAIFENIQSTSLWVELTAITFLNYL